MSRRACLHRDSPGPRGRRAAFASGGRAALLGRGRLVLAVCLVAGLAWFVWAAEEESQESPSQEKKPAPAEEVKRPGQPGAPGKARRRPLPEVDRVTLKSGRVLEGLVLREDKKQLILKMKLTTKGGRVTGFISFPLLSKEVVSVKRASPVGRALTELAWKKEEVLLRQRVRAARRRGSGSSTGALPTPAPEAPAGPSAPPSAPSPRDILLEEARRLDLKVPPGATTEELQQLVEAEQSRRRRQADAFVDEAINAFSEAAALLPNLTYQRRSGRALRTVYREVVLERMLTNYRRAYRLLDQAAQLDPAAEQSAQEWQQKVRQALSYLETVVRTSDLVEGANGGRRNNPDRR